MAEAGNSYRILVSASNGRILRSRLIVASDDTEAIRRAAAYHQKRLDFEIWKGRTLSSDWEHGAVRQRLVKSRLERRGFSYNPTSQAGAARKDRRKLLVVSLKEGGRVKDLVALLASASALPLL